MLLTEGVSSDPTISMLPLNGESLKLADKAASEELKVFNRPRGALFESKH
jgi:hypothetical protein